jgi:hypothetical protein
VIVLVGVPFLIVAAIVFHYQQRREPTRDDYVRYLIRHINAQAVNVHLNRRALALEFVGSERGCRWLRSMVRNSGDEAPPQQLVRCTVDGKEVWEASAGQ